MREHLLHGAVDLRASDLEAPQVFAQRLCHAAPHPQHRMQVVRHELEPQHLDLGRKLGDSPRMRLDPRAELGGHEPRSRIDARARAQRRPRAVPQRHRDQIASGSMVVPVAAPPTHAVDRIAHQAPRLLVEVPARRDGCGVRFHAPDSTRTRPPSASRLALAHPCASLSVPRIHARVFRSRASMRESFAPAHPCASLSVLRIHARVSSRSRCARASMRGNTLDYLLRQSRRL